MRLLSVTGVLSVQVVPEVIGAGGPCELVMSIAVMDTVFTEDGGAVLVERDMNVIRLCVGGADQVLTREEAREVAARLRIAASNEGS